MSVVEEVLVLMKGSPEEKLPIIEKRTRERLSALLGSPDVFPLKLEYIVVDVTVKRFNRIGSEGMKTHNQEGLSMTFPDNDFKEYEDEINAFRQEQEKDKDGMRGLVVFK